VVAVVVAVEVAVVLTGALVGVAIVGADVGLAIGFVVGCWVQCTGQCAGQRDANSPPQSTLLHSSTSNRPLHRGTDVGVEDGAAVGNVVGGENGTAVGVSDGVGVGAADAHSRSSQVYSVDELGDTTTLHSRLRTVLALQSVQSTQPNVPIVDPLRHPTKVWFGPPTTSVNGGRHCGGKHR
jgi:hypothetical protein